MEEILELADVGVNSVVKCEMNTKYRNENTVVTSKCCRFSKLEMQ